MKRKLLIPIAASAVLLAAGVASAQMFGGGRGLHSFGRMGGDVTVEIYDADPATGAQPIETLTLERPLTLHEVVANYEGAAFVMVTGDNFSRTVELATVAVEVQIYAEDPATGAEPILETTLADMSGLRSLIADTEDATFVVVTGNDFTRTIDVSRAPAAAERFQRRGDHQFQGRAGPRVGNRGGHNGPAGPGGFGPRGN
jgi:hypothetical protein